MFSASFLTRLFSKVLKVENENVYNLQFESSEDLCIICTCTLQDVYVEIRMQSKYFLLSVDFEIMRRTCSLSKFKKQCTNTDTQHVGTVLRDTR